MTTIRDVVVLGGGSAGLLSALTLEAKLPRLRITVVRSREIGIIGVGEATTANLPRHLFNELRLDPGEFHRRTQLSWKLGIRFLWGPRPWFDFTFGNQLDVKWTRLARNNGFYCREDFSEVDTLSALMSRNKAFVRGPDGAPLVGLNHGFHLENERFVAYLEAKAAERGIAIVDDTVESAQQGEEGVTSLVLKSGAALRADLYVDCSGFRSQLLGRTLGEPHVSYRSTLFNDRAVVGGWPRTFEPIQTYTTAETMDAGWCWRIDHPDVINRGYVYSSSFISDADAEAEFRAKNPLVRETRVIPYVAGRYARCWVKNVYAVGNASGFVEPLESTGLAVTVVAARLLAESLHDCDRRPTPTLVQSVNRIVGDTWDSIRWFLGFHFRFNTRLDTEYWRACRAGADLGPAAAIVDYYRENGPSTYGRAALLGEQEYAGMEGYLCMLVGQAVPYDCDWSPTERELAIWSGIRAENRARALTGVSAAEAIQRMSSPDWRWAVSAPAADRLERPPVIPGIFR